MRIIHPFLGKPSWKHLAVWLGLLAGLGISARLSFSDDPTLSAAGIYGATFFTVALFAYAGSRFSKWTDEKLR